MSRRRIEALRNLASRPGTEHEGRVAAAMLARHEAKRPPLEIAREIARVAYRKVEQDITAQESIRQEILTRFPRGTRIYYNRWAYYNNQPGVVIGYPVKAFKGSWGWIRIRFDGLKSVQGVPIYTTLGWHLSTEPVSGEESIRLRGIG